MTTADQFVRIRDVPVFVQHCTAVHGRVICFGPRQLKQIAERCNRRIAETGDYVPITIGHTPDPKDQKPDPEVIGFAGPFRYGRYKGKPAILADFRVYRQDVHKLKRYPRRSPEVWIGQRIEDTYIDPIALLGGTTPKLDMGLLLYSAERNGEQCWKYAAAPAAGNVFVPNTDVVKEKNMLTPEDVQTLINAIEQLDWVQWIKKLFAEANEEPAEQPAKEQNEADSENSEEENPQKNELPSEEANVSPEKAREILRHGEVKGHPLTEAQRGMFGAIAGKSRSQKPADGNLLRYAQLEAEVQRLRNELQLEQQARKYAQRKALLQTLNQVYQFDLAKEVARCAPEKLSDEQFEDHISCIKENYQRLPIGATLPTFMGTEEQANDVLEKKIHDKARQIAERKALRGEAVDYAETVELIRAGKL